MKKFKRLISILLIFTVCIGILSSTFVTASASNGALKNVNGVWYYMSGDTIIYDYEGLVPYGTIRGGTIRGRFCD